MISPAMTSQPLPPHPFSSPSVSFLSSAPRKRRAASPPTPVTPTAGQVPFPADSPTICSPHGTKRRRPNLSNGFSGLSISPTDLRQPPKLVDHLDDSEEEVQQPYPLNDVEVEVIPDTPRKHRPWSIPNRAEGSNSSSTSDADTDYDSDVTFRLPTRLPAQQADSVDLPDSVKPLDDINVEDVTAIKPRKKRDRDDNGVGPRKRRKSQGMDVDMEAEEPSDAESIEEISSSPNRGRRRTRTRWHEPEKDRIVITSLSPSSRSSSADSGSPQRQFIQPGNQGFTISPSLLMHLLAAQKDTWNLPPMASMATEKGLVLYRPLGISPGQPQWEEIVKNWRGEPNTYLGIEGDADSARFEEVDDDENLEQLAPSNLDSSMDIESGSLESPMDVDEDMSMDVE